MRKILMLLCCSAIALASSALAQDRGLRPADDALGGPFWQTRFERDASAAGWVAVGFDAPGLAANQAQTVRLLGDYQFSALRLGNTGGLRLTGGMLINLPKSGGPGLLPADNGAALPYAGVGYTSGGQRGDWGFSADLGLSAQGLGSVRLDRLLSGAGGLEGGLQLQPMLRVGMNLTF